MGKLHFLICFILFFLWSPVADAQKIEFSCNPRLAQIGDSVTVKWKLSGLTDKQLANVTIGYSKGDPFQKGVDHEVDSMKVLADKSKLIVLVYSPRMGKNIRKTAKLQVYKPIFRSIEYPDSVSPGDLLPIDWSCSYTEYLTINNDTTRYSPAFSAILFADSTGLVTLTAHNRNGYKVSRQLTYKPIYASEVNADTLICAGDPARIVWNIKDADSVRVSLLPDSLLPESGYTTFFPKANCSHTFSYIKNGERHVRKFVFQVLPQGTFFIDVPPTVMSGDEVTIEWRFPESKSVYIRQLKKSFGASGTTKVIAKSSRDFTFEFQYNKKKYSVTRSMKVSNRQLLAGYREIRELTGNERLVFEIFGTDQSAYPDSVKVFVSVFDIRGYFIKNITGDGERSDMVEKYFKGLIENIDGVRYPVDAFTVREVNKEKETFDFSFALDYSGSMANDIDNLEKAVTDLVSLKYPEDRMAFVKFDHRILNLTRLSANKDSLMAAVDRIGFDSLGGSTALYAGTYDAIINTNNNAPNKKIVVFTDGYENSSSLYMGSKASTGQELVDLAREYDIPISFVSFGRGTNEKLLNMISWMTNGSFYNLRNSNQINKVFNEIVRVSKYYYEITYKPVQKQGQHDVTLVYYNNQQFQEATRRVFIGSDYDMAAAERETMYEAGMVDSTMDSLIATAGSAITQPQVITLFDYDKDIIDAQYFQNIMNYSLILKKNNLYKALIIGHSDLKGSERACRIISEKRAEAVRNLLITYGVDPSRIMTMGMGRSMPVWEVETTEYQARENRRVEIVIIK